MSKIDGLSVKNRIVLSTTSQMASQVIAAGLAVIILKTLTRNLGIYNYGIYAIVITFITTFSLLADLGLNSITAREIAKHPSLASRIISNNMALRLTLSLAMIPVISGIGLIFYPHATHLLRLGILLFSLDPLFNSIYSVSLSYFIATVNSHVSAVIAVFNVALFLVFLVVAISLKFGVIGAISAYLLADFITAICSLVILRRKLAISLRFRFSEWPTIIKISLPLGIIQIINMIYLKADGLLLSVMRTSAEVGYYNVAYSVIIVISMLPTFLMAALIPSLVTGDSKRLQNIAQRAFDIVLVVFVMIVVVGVLLRNDVVVLVSGKAYLPAALPFAILLGSTTFSALNAVCGYVAVALDKYRKFVIISLINAVLNILLNILLIPKFGIKGAASATLITEILSFCITYIVFNKTTSVSISPKHYWKVGVAAIVTFCIGFYLVANAVSNIGYSIIYSLMLSACYILILLLVKGLPKDILYLMGAFKLKKSS